jgi:hypothetical protein
MLLHTFSHRKVDYVGCEANFATHGLEKVVARQGLNRT